MAVTQEHSAAQPLLGKVLKALLDFEQMPGRYPVARREPAVLFDQVGTVLQLASDRAVDGLAPVDADHERGVRRAARYFVRTVMLRPGSDQYTLLGLTPDSPAEMQRDHYRMMIRLTHPDFASAGEAWPADAASRINFANDVLSSPVQRHLYNASLAQEPAAPATRRDLSVPEVTFWERARDGAVSQLLAGRGKLAVFTVLLLAGFWWLFSGPDHPGTSLMVKRRAASPATTIPSTEQDAAPPEISLEDVQPTMDQVLGALRSGRGETVQWVLDSESRSHPSTTLFVDHFNQLLAGRTVRGLDEVNSSSDHVEGMFVVNSAIDLQLQDASRQEETLRLNLKAFFLPQAGAPVLTQLVAQP